jgi:hypothetical protein
MKHIRVRQTFVWRFVLACALLTASLFTPASRLQPARAQATETGIEPPISLRADAPRSAQPRPEAASPAQLAAPSWSAWQALYFDALVNNNFQLYRRVGLNAEERISNNSANDRKPRVAPNGSRLVFFSDRAGNYDIYTSNLDGSGVIQLTSNPKNDVNPAWSPDGSRIVFQSYRDGQAEIYVMNTDGSGQTRLTVNPDYDGLPSWSPDGTKIAFSTYRYGGYRIWIMGANGSNPVQMNTQPYSENPVWSPDGSLIAFDADNDADGWQELWLMAADGSNPHQLTDYISINHNDFQDHYASSWTFVQTYIGFTQATFVPYQGQFYYYYSYMSTINLETGTEGSLSSHDFAKDWDPELQMIDKVIPTCKIAYLPPVSPSTFTVKWFGTTGISGVAGYQISFRDNSDAWQTFSLPPFPGDPIPTSYQFSGLAGHTKSFRCRTLNNAEILGPWSAAPDVTTQIDSYPPVIQLHKLPLFSGTTTQVTWDAFDPGKSTITNVDIETRQLPNGAWSPFCTVNQGTSCENTGTVGATYEFRARGADSAGNVSAWTSSNLPTTTYTAHQVVAMVTDLAGLPVMNPDVQMIPPPLGKVSDALTGGIQFYFGQLADPNPQAAATWSKSGYGVLPATPIDINTEQTEIVLPPANDLVQNGGFESGNLASSWSITGAAGVVVSETVPHSGQRAAWLGNPVPTRAQTKLISPGYYLVNSTTGPDDTIHAIWMNDNNRLHYASRPAGWNWSVPEVIFANPSTTLINHSVLKIAPNGDIHLAFWVTLNFTSGKLYYTKHTAATGWSNPTLIASQGYLYSGNSINIILDAAGNPQLYWLQVSDQDGGSHLYSSSQSVDGNWLPPADVLQIPAPYRVGYSYLELFMDRNGRTHLATTVYHTSTNVYCPTYSFRNPGENWQTPEILCNLSQDSQVKMAVDGLGSVHLMTSYNEPQLLHFFDRDLAGQWTASASLPGFPVFGRVFLEKGENLYLAWKDFTTGMVNYASRPTGGAWSIEKSFPGGDAYDMTIDAAGKPLILISKNGLRFYRQQVNGTWISVAVPQTAGSVNAQLRILTDQSVCFVYDTQTSIYGYEINTVGQDSTNTLSQSLTIPSGMNQPVLSFLAQTNPISIPGSGVFRVLVQDGANISTLFETETADLSTKWAHQHYDLAAWQNKPITITFQIDQKAHQPRTAVYLDEISLGAARPDLWVNLKAQQPSAQPGGEAGFTLTYGNRGAAIAPSSTITLTLPASLVLVSANPPPTTQSPLTWQIDALPAASGPYTITLTTFVASGQSATLKPSAKIGPVKNELEVGNNLAEAAIQVAYWLQLPLIFRDSQSP